MFLRIADIVSASALAVGAERTNAYGLVGGVVRLHRQFITPRILLVGFLDVSSTDEVIDAVGCTVAGMRELGCGLRDLLDLHFRTLVCRFFIKARRGRLERVLCSA
mgnify:CR=1 FL=1